MSKRVQKIDHIGIAVTNLEEAVQLYTLLCGEGPTAIEDVPDQKVRTAFFHAGESHLELLFPTAPDSPVASFLAKRGPGIHHLCVAVADIERTLAALKHQGMRLIDETPRQGAQGKRVAFVHPKSLGGVLLELSEAPRPACAPEPRRPHGGRADDSR